MNGCGRPWNGTHKVTGVPLTCGLKLYWRVPGENDRERTLEVLLCEECKAEKGQ